ncbi:MAG: hypothetical protein Q8P08_01410 [bacterium]|nr:hypothetical protein [bacterium]
MQGLEYLVFVLAALFGLIFLFSPKVIPSNHQIKQILEIARNKDVIIIFNSGGWGYTPLKEAKDLAFIVKGVEETLNNWKYSTIVVPYNRTKDSLVGEITGLKELLNSFKNSSRDLAGRIETIVNRFPDKNIIVVGLSNGAAFVNETYGKISENIKKSVYAVAIGTPFWIRLQKSDNVLQLNSEKDTLVRGKIGSLLWALIKTPFIGVFLATGHEYLWSSPGVKPQIVAFLEEKFVR